MEEKEPDDKALLKTARENLKACIDEESEERKKMLDDLRFCTLEQWPTEIRNARENDIENGPRPCLTIDKINQYIVQVVNDMRQGRPGINVRPQDDKADVETAKILKGIVRNIEDQSSADIVYATAAENAVKMGLGFFRITTEYVSEDSFDQDIFIRAIPNTFAVYLGKHIMPDGSDAEMAYIVEEIPLERFKKEYPKAKYAQDAFDELQDQVTFWRTEKTVTVVEEYRFDMRMEELLYLADGTTMERSVYDRWPPEAGERPEVIEKRHCMKKALKWAKMTGVEVLDKRDLPGKYIPVVEVVGREAVVDGKRRLWGLVRPAKDSLRMYNYWASTITEKMALAPKAPFVGAVGQFKTQNERWKKANVVNYATLEYDPIDINGNAIPAPQRQGATPMEAALLQQMQVIEHDVQTSLGMFKAAVGETESQQSGRAILALQKESDTGTYHFGANQAASIRHAGRIIIDMIPHYYDTKRIVRIIGEDGEVKTAQLDPEQKSAFRKVQTPEGIRNIYNPGLGQYDVAITVGPSYNTKRMEAAATFVEMSKGSADPASAAVLRYLVMRNSDSAGADEAAKLLKTLLPPQALQAMDENDPIPPRVQAVLMQAEQKMMLMQEEGQKLQQENQQLKAKSQEGLAKVALDREVAAAEFALAQQKQANEIQLEREKAEADIAIKKAIAEAEHGIQVRKMQFEQECRAADEKAKLDERARAEEAPLLENAMPKFVEALQAITAQFADVVKAQQEGMAQMAAAVAAPRQTQIGAIRRDAEGRIVGASAVQTVQ